MDGLLSEKQAARILGVSPRRLERYRAVGTSPRYARIGRLIRYRQCDLANWVERSLVHSTLARSECGSSIEHSDRPQSGQPGADSIDLFGRPR
jgi:hypothetical protein